MNINYKTAHPLIALSLCMGACTPGIQKKSNKQKPNVIYFYFDDLGYGELGCYGQTKIKTPHIDQIASEGMRFTQHYTTFPVSAPARCALLTGKHAGHSFIRSNYTFAYYNDDLESGQMPLPEGQVTIADIMKQAGYTTGAIGKWSLGMPDSPGSPELHGFDYFYGYQNQTHAHNYYPDHLWENGVRVPVNNKFIRVHSNIPVGSPDEAFEAFKGTEYSIDMMTEKALKFIRDNKGKPFFLYLPFITPHLSLQAPDEAVNEYIGQWDEQPYYGTRGNGYAPCKYPLSTYAAMITYTDKQIGRMMALLKELGLDDNTIFMISSDNGPATGGGTNRRFFNSSGGLRGGKMDIYEGGIRMPFIVRWPGKVPAGSISDFPSAQFDMFATLSELTGEKMNWKTDGVSLLPTMMGNPEKQKQREYLYFEYTDVNGQQAIIKNGRWKGVKTNVKRGNTNWEVYDLKNDLAESNDLAAEHPDMITEFERIVLKEHKRATVVEWEFVNKNWPKL